MEVEPSRNKKPETGRLYSGKYKAEHFRPLFSCKHKHKNKRMKFISRFIEIVIDMKYFGSLVTLQKRFSNNFDIISNFVDFGENI